MMKLCQKIFPAWLRVHSKTQSQVNVKQLGLNNPLGAEGMKDTQTASKSLQWARKEGS